jgi:peptidyl-prolyl cis-trans isomerase D
MMLQRMRDNTQSLGFKILVGILIFVLAVFGFGAFDLFTASDPDVASVGSREITESAVAVETERARNRLLAEMGDDADPSQIEAIRLRGQVLEQLISNAVMGEAAATLNLAVPMITVDKSLTENPSFQVNGKFDSDLYVRLLQQYGYQPKDFRERVAEEMAISQLQTAVNTTASLPRWQLREVAALLNQRRDIAWLPLTRNEFGPRAEVSDEEINDHYSENRIEYRTEESLDVDYVILTATDLADSPKIEVSEEDLKTAFAEEIKSLAENEQRSAAHILLRVSDDRDDAATLKFAGELREQLVNGGDFAALAKKHSDDPGSAATGGELGAAGRGVYDPAFEKALFALNEGDLSEPVKSQFGYHLIQLSKIEKPEEPTFDAKREELLARLKETKAKELFVESVRQMDSLAFEQNTALDPIAKEFGLKIESANGIVRGTSDGLFANQVLKDAAFSEEVLDEAFNSKAVEFEENKAAVLRVRTRHEPQDRPLDAVRDDVIASIRAEKADVAIEQAAAEGLVQLEAGDSVDAIARSIGASWQTAAQASRSQVGVPEAVLKKAFELPLARGEASARTGRAVARVDLQDGQALVVITAIEDGDIESMTEQEADSLAQYFRSRVGELEFTALYRTVEDNAGVRRREAAAAQ